MSLQSSSEQAINSVSACLGVDQAEFREALVAQVLYMKGGNVRKQYIMQHACDNLAAISKTLYGRLFGWIVANINLILAPEKVDKKAVSSALAPGTHSLML